MIPVNSENIVMGFPANYFFKTLKNPDGTHMFVSQKAQGGKVIPNQGKLSPTITVSKDEIVAFHIINEEKNEKNQKSLHNINIDEFNVHSKNLGYFETDSITFIANQRGTFHYYCTVHPEMIGDLIVK